MLLPNQETHSIKPKIKDIVMFVAGTTDPGNLDTTKHKSNADYWKAENPNITNFRDGVKKLRSEFEDLHVEDQFFSWSGDNSNEERKEGGRRLLDLFLRVYKNWYNKHVYIHLIGHSHGGNVINEFTKTIATAHNFPSNWTIRSITYLSTPFFQKQHQLNHTKLHPECSILNVFNTFDMTQRFVADYTLKSFDSLVNFLNGSDFKTAQKKVLNSKVDTSPLTSFYLDDKKDGPKLWQETGELLGSIRDVIDLLVRFLSNNAEQMPEALEKLVRILKRLNVGINLSSKSFLETKRTEFSRFNYVDDIHLQEIIAPLIELLDIKTGINDSYLLRLLEGIISTNNRGFVDRIDDTGQDPTRQAHPLTVKQIPIASFDPYNQSDKSNNYHQFIYELEEAVRKNKPQREILARLFAQLVTPTELTVVTSVLHMFEIFVTGETDDLCKKLRHHIETYHDVVKYYHKDMYDRNLKLGSIPDLVLRSHSLSHTQFFEEAHQALASCFGSERISNIPPHMQPPPTLT